jgi:hypothetical protein
MDKGAIDRLSRLICLRGSRRAALTALITSGLIGGGSIPGSAKVGRLRRGKGRDRRSRKKRRGAGSQGRTINHCIAPDGTDLNELYGISAQFVTSFCKEVGSGEKRLAPGAPWFVSRAFDAVPPEFEPEGTNPQEDFFAKFVEIKYVIDRSTVKEKTVVFPNAGNLFQGEVDELVLVHPSTLGVL